jgi:hypothetical protein
MTNKLQSKTWRQWDEDTWFGVYCGMCIDCREAVTPHKYKVVITNSHGETTLAKIFDTEAEALDFIKEFIADD